MYILLFFQANVLVLLDDSFSIRSTTTGELQCKIVPQEEDLEHLDFELGMSPCLFITKDIAGYIVDIYDEEYGDSDDDTCEDQCEFEHANLRIYDTKSGALLTSAKILKLIDEPMDDRTTKVLAKGRTLCFTCDGGQEIHVIQVVGKALKRDHFCFPLEHFVKLKKIDASTRDCKMKLLGFLAKTNIVIGNLTASNSKSERMSYAFGLDLDAATSAKDEEGVNSAFSILAQPASKKAARFDDYEFQPVYRTDRSTMSVELVGVASKRDTDGNRKITAIGSNMFVTEMQCSNDL